jgi:hypothetical protein
MSVKERIEPYIAREPHSMHDYMRAAFAIDDEHRSGDITSAEMGGRLAMLSAMYRDLRRKLGPER